MKLYQLISTILIGSFLVFSSSCKSSKTPAPTPEKKVELNSSKVSPEVAKLINLYDQKTPLEELKKEFSLKDIDGKTYLGGLAKMQDGSSKEVLSSLGVIIGTQAGDIWTVSVPIDKIKEISMIDQLLYFESKKAQLKNK